MINLYRFIYLYIETKKKVVLSFLGSTLDLPTHENRWQKWRPNISLGQFPDLLIDRIELFTQKRFKSLTDTIISDLGAVSPETEVCPHNLELRDPWNFEEVFQQLYSFAQHYPFDVDKEEYLINITTGTHVVQICLFLLTESRHLPGRLLQISPSRKRSSSKHADPGTYSVIDLDLSKYDQLAARFKTEATEAAEFLKSGINTLDSNFNRMIERIEQVSVQSTAPILLCGPTGAGKSQLAKRIYELKKQRNNLAGPLVEVNCSTLKGEMAMSTLFGHKKGAFTGAVTARAGLLKAAHGGLLFLDEIGELGMDEQSMLLRALEEKRFLPVGSDTEVESDFQLISGTNRDLLERVADGSFRSDLFARINLWMFELPSLRDRTKDIAPNIDYEVERLSRATGRKVSFNKEGYNTFLDFALQPDSLWTGNFRDLNAAITRMGTLSGTNRIGVDLVREEMGRLKTLWSRELQSETGQFSNYLEQFFDPDGLAEIDQFDQVQLAEVIRVCRKSRSLSEAGRQLFAASRAKRKATNDSDRLRKYLAKFDLSWDDIQDSDTAI